MGRGAVRTGLNPRAVIEPLPAFAGRRFRGRGKQRPYITFFARAGGGRHF